MTAAQATAAQATAFSSCSLHLTPGVWWGQKTAGRWYQQVISLVEKRREKAMHGDTLLLSAPPGFWAMPPVALVGRGGPHDLQVSGAAGRGSHRERRRTQGTGGVRSQKGHVLPLPPRPVCERHVAGAAHPRKWWATRAWASGSAAAGGHPVSASRVLPCASELIPKQLCRPRRHSSLPQVPLLQSQSTSESVPSIAALET